MLYTSQASLRLYCVYHKPQASPRVSDITNPLLLCSCIHHKTVHFVFLTSQTHSRCVTFLVNPFSICLTCITNLFSLVNVVKVAVTTEWQVSPQGLLTGVCLCSHNHMQQAQTTNNALSEYKITGQENRLLKGNKKDLW